MTNNDKIIWVPKKQRQFFYKDIDFNVSNYVLDKDILDIPTKGYLINKALYIRHIGETLLVVFILFGIPLLVFCSLYIAILTGGLSGHNQVKNVDNFGIAAVVLAILTWIIFFINIFGIGFFYSSKLIEPIVDYFNKLVKENKLVADLKKYPVVFIMAFYYNNKGQFPIDYPKTYQIYSPVLALIGLGIFFDKLYDYINKTNN